MLSHEQRKQATVILRAITRDANLPVRQRAEAAGLLHELAGGRDTRIRRRSWGAGIARPRGR